MSDNNTFHARVMNNDDFRVHVDGQILEYWLTDSVRDEICQWLTANELDYREVVAPQQVTIADGQLTATMYDLNDNGQRFTRDGYEAAKVSRTVPLKVDPPKCWWRKLPADYETVYRP